MSENTSATTSPSRKQIALDLTCAIMSNPSITGRTAEQAAEEALHLLNHLEQRLKVRPTAHQPAD